MKKTMQLVLWILVLQLISYGMGMVTKNNLSPWYESLYKSSLTPPGFVFAIMWGVLYVMLAMVGWQLYQKKAAHGTQLKMTFTAQLVLNGLWTPLFFHLHWTGVAFMDLVGIVLLTTLFLIVAWRQARLLCWLMCPYWSWVCFASYLNFIVWYSNP